MKLKKAILIALVVVGMCANLFGADVHVVISEDPILVRDGETGKEYDKVDGYCTINWKEASKFGFCYAYATISGVKLYYEFMLVSITKATDKEIRGPLQY